MSYVQNDIQSWGTFLQIFRGLLELIKTMYLMLIWKFQADETPILQKEETLPQNSVTI
jgi:hypothetical protein